MPTQQLFTRLTTVHRPDCDLVADDGVLPAAVPDPAQMAAALGSAAAAAYADECRPLYDDLRRIVGQIAGLAILAQLTGSADVAGLDELESCRRRWSAAAGRLGRLTAPPALVAHRAQIEAAHVFSGRALGTFPQIRPRGDNEAAFDAIARLVRRAYAHLSAASAPRAGLEMVDLTHACCSCGR